MGSLLDGKLVSNKIRLEIKKRVDGLSIKPCLCVISVGHDESSKVYIKMKEKACREVGILFKHLCFEEAVLEEEIVAKILELNTDDNVHSILVQLPLPNKYNKDMIINSVSYLKDVDGLSINNSGKLFTGLANIIPCTPLGIVKLLGHYHISIVGKNVVIVGKSNLVGKPLLELFLESGATVTMCHSRTINLADYTKKADILVVAVGKKGLIKKEMIKEDAVIVDVGINRIDNKIYGDVESDVIEKCSFMTPVPGGVGPMTVSCLLLNILFCYEHILNI